MKKIHIILLLLLFATSGCEKGVFLDSPDCDYSLELRYDYNMENSSTDNMIEYYVYTIDEYVFDQSGILFAHRTIMPDGSRKMMNSQWDLPAGRYSVIAIGNKDERSTAFDFATSGAPQIGSTRRDDMRLSLDNAQPMDNGTYGASEKLYYGYRTFTVRGQDISRIRVDMINAHLTFKFRVTWRNNATPAKGVDYHAVLTNIASRYALMPEYIYPAGSFNYEVFNAAQHDDYPTQYNNVIHHIPHTVYGGQNPLTYRNNTRVNADNEMWGEFTTYRIKLPASPKLRIQRSSDNQLIIPNEIDLQGYFNWLQATPDYSLKQDYQIDIVVDGSQISISPLSMSDWDEGGSLGV